MKAKWEMMMERTIGNFEVTMFWNGDSMNKKFRVQERVISRNVITQALETKVLSKADKAYRQWASEAYVYSESRFCVGA